MYRLFLQSLLSDLIKISRKNFRLLNRYQGLNGIDKKLESYLDYNNGFFVELGANDGISQSNTWYFEKYRQWDGILIEPTPHKYLECKKNRRASTACCACVATTPQSKDSEYVTLYLSDLMTIVDDTLNQIPRPMEHARLGLQYAEGDDVVPFGSKAKTLSTVLRELSAPPLMDLLSLDAEGMELEILKGLDHSAYRFKYVCIEVRDLPKVTNFLNERNYNLVTQLTSHDFLFENTQCI